jgi:hypothetical protein
VFDCLNWVDNMRVSMDAVAEEGRICEAAICYTGDLLNSARPKYDLKYYTALCRRPRKGRRAYHRGEGHGGPPEAGGGACAVQGAARGHRPADPFPHA